MKLKVILCTVLFLTALCGSVHAGSLCNKYYCPGYDSSPAYSPIRQKTTNKKYNDILVSNKWGNYLQAYCRVNANTGDGYEPVTEKICFYKGTKKRVTPSNNRSNWGVNTFLKLELWSGNKDEMDYNEVDWNYY